MDARRRRRRGMKKLWMALGTLAALSIGIVLAEGKDDKAANHCKSGDATACCCCAKSCPK